MPRRRPRRPAATPPVALVAAAAAALAAALGAGPARADLLFVLNSTDPSIAVLDGRTRETLRRIPALREVHHLVPTPDGRLILVGDSAGNEMVFLDPETGAVVARERIANPYHLDFSPDGTRLVVTGLRRDQVDLYGWDGRALSFQGRVRAGDMPSHIAFSPDGRTAYVTTQGDRGLAAIDLATNTLAWKIEVGREPAGVLWHRGRLLVGVMGSDHVAVVDPEARAVVERIPVGRGAHAVFAAPDGSALYATSRVDSRITALDPATLGVLRTYEVPGGPDCLTFSPDGRVWATLRWAGRVGVLDPATGALETIRVGRSPHGILYRPRPGTAPPLLAQAGPQTGAPPPPETVGAPVVVGAPRIAR